MEFVIIPLVALMAATLSLFSGFGLGTILTPAFALFFPVSVAVALSAVVHMLNNIFKVALMGKKADFKVSLHFGIPAIVAAFAGAGLLILVSKLPALATYHLGNHTFEITAVKLIVAIIMITFALIEILPRFQGLEFDKRLLPLGGLISGFFGGLSGNQGAMRAAFLIRAGLSKEAFIGTGVVIAFMVDLTRISVYAANFSVIGFQQNRIMLLLATLAAFIGSFVGSRLVKKVTLRTIQLLVAIMLVGIGILLAVGII